MSKRDRPRRQRAKTRRPTVGLALIAYNEEDNLPRLLDSIKGAFDQVVHVDNHSTDRTLEIFQKWCRRASQPNVVDQFEWSDDFAAKRNHAYGLLTTDWTCWADCDDTIQNAQLLRAIAAQTPANLEAVAFRYDYLFNHDGECITSFPRERLVRRGAGVWVGRAHDVQVIANGAIAYNHQVHWVHHDMDGGGTHGGKERDKRILDRWHTEEPDNQFVTAALEAYGVSDTAFASAMGLALQQERAKAARSLGDTRFGIAA